MRILFALWLVPVLAPVLWAEEEPGKESKADDEAEWAIEKPQSKPRGEPVALRVGLETSKTLAIEHRSDMDMKMRMGGMEMPQAMSTGVRMKVKVLSVAEDGTAEVEMPLRLTKVLVNGQDMTAMMAGMFKPDAKGVGRLDKDGRPVPGSFKASGFGMMDASMVQNFETDAYAYLPRGAVRVGEVWEVAASEFGRGYANAGLENAEFDGAAYATLEGIEERGGAPCARIRVVFSLRFGGENLRMQGQPAKGRGRVKGEGVYWHGLDGYMRGGEITSRLKMSMQVMGSDLDSTADMKLAIEAGPEEASGAAAEEATGSEMD
jgi:hypothetical protein